MSTNLQLALPLSSASKIASYAISPVTTTTSSPNATELSQATHRINLLNTPAWSPFFNPPQQPNQALRILEIGCGQGTATQVLAHLLTTLPAGGHIDALDPASLDYGAPWTLGQAQGHLSAGPLGGYMTFHQAAPTEFLSRSTEKWDVAVLAHCIWYFTSPDELSQILTALKGRVGAVCMAEYALHATERGAVPHVLAALARGMFEAHRGESEENVRNTVSPGGIREIAGGVGWKVSGEGVVVPGRELEDGKWEVGGVVGGGFVGDVEREIVGGEEAERVRGGLVAARDAVAAAVEGVGGIGGVRTMDVWVGSFVEG